MSTCLSKAQAKRTLNHSPFMRCLHPKNDLHQTPGPTIRELPYFFHYGGFLKWWYPTTMGFPTKNDHSEVFRGYHHLRKHPYHQFLFLFQRFPLRFQNHVGQTLHSHHVSSGLFCHKHILRFPHCHFGILPMLHCPLLRWSSWYI